MFGIIPESLSASLQNKASTTDAMLAELMAVVGMANETDLVASGHQVEIDERFKT